MSTDVHPEWQAELDRRARAAVADGKTVSLLTPPQHGVDPREREITELIARIDGKPYAIAKQEAYEDRHREPTMPARNRAQRRRDKQAAARFIRKAQRARR